MQLLSCKCLNIKIYAQKIIDKVYKGLPPHKCFSADFIEVILSSEAICFENICLVEKLFLKDWLVHRCINCNTITHACQQAATPTDSAVTIVNTCLIRDEKEIEELFSSPSFSKLYNVVLQEDSSLLKMEGVVTEGVEEELDCLQRSYEQYAAKQKQELRRKVEQFERDQQEAFRMLLSQLNKHKDNLLSVVIGNRHNKLLANEDASEAWVSCCRQQKNSSKGHLSPHGGVQVATTPSFNPSPKGSTPPAAAALATLGAKPLKADLLDNLPESFMFDEDDAEDEGGKTDDNDEEKDEVSEMPSIPLATKTTTGAFDIGHNDDDDDDFSLYSSSVPISVPRHSRNISFDKFDKNPPKDPEAMGASIMEMAKSCRQPNSVDMFGDLPTTIMQTKRFEVMSRVKEMPGLSMDW